MSNDGGPAFPAEGPNSGQFENPGMTLRDYFAAKAMAALINSPFPNVSENVDIAAAAYAMADAMIGARK